MSVHVRANEKPSSPEAGEDAKHATHLFNDCNRCIEKFGWNVTKIQQSTAVFVVLTKFAVHNEPIRPTPTAQRLMFNSSDDCSARPTIPDFYSFHSFKDK